MNTDHQPHQVYLVGNREMNVYKIGFSINVKKRMSAIQVPFDLELFETVDCENIFVARALEMLLHMHFYCRRIRGEWFRSIQPKNFLKEAQFALVEARRIVGIV